MKTGTIFRSDDEYWAWVERQIRLRERLFRAARYLAVMGACVLSLFVFLYFVATHTPPRKTDPWHSAIDSVGSKLPP